MTRWLSLEACVVRLLEQYECLLCFAKQLSAKNESTAKEVVAIMEKPETKCYLFVLQKILHELNALNKFLQSNKVILHNVEAEIDKRYRTFVSCFLQRRYVTSALAAVVSKFATKKII